MSVTKFNSAFIIFILILSYGCQKDNLQNADIDGFTSEDFGKRCASNSHMYELVQNPSFYDAHTQKMSWFEKFLNDNKNEKSNCSSPMVIPVAVHYNGVSNTTMECLIEMAQRQIDILNDDFNGLNPDLVNWNTAQSLFGGSNYGNSCIRFCLASKDHPSGFGLAQGDVAVTANQIESDFSSSWAGYLNIFVQPIGGGILGYSSLGGNGNGDGVVINLFSFSTGSCGNVSAQYPYNEGRTLTHEMGHYFTLRHIWGDGGCGVDDGISDTPLQGSPSAGCPQLGTGTCNSVDMHMNFMDYTNDECMYMFSEGQTFRVKSYTEGFLQQRLKNPSLVCDLSTINSDAEEQPSCNAPQLQVNGTDVSWSEVSSSTAYQIDYKAQNETQWQSATFSSTAVSAENLPDGIYLIRVRAQCGAGVWSDFSSIETLVINANGNNSDPTVFISGNITLKLTLDNYGSETTFGLKDQSGNIVESFGPFSDNTNGTEITESFSLPNQTFTFFIEDSYGDGICCEYGSGFAQILFDNTLLQQIDGSFGSSAEFQFTVGGPVGGLMGYTDKPSSIIPKTSSNNPF